MEEKIARKNAEADAGNPTISDAPIIIQNPNVEDVDEAGNNNAGAEDALPQVQAPDAE